MNVFDSEAELSNQEAAQLCFTLAQAGLNLEEIRAFFSTSGTERVN